MHKSETPTVNFSIYKSHQGESIHLTENHVCPLNNTGEPIVASFIFLQANPSPVLVVNGSNNIVFVSSLCVEIFLS